MQIIDQGDKILYKDVEVIRGQLGDMAAEWWTQEDWDKWNKQVEAWKADGTYGQKSTVNLTIVKNPAFDDIRPTNKELPIDSHRMIFLNLEDND